MSISFCFTPSICHQKQTPPRIPLYKPLNPINISSRPKLKHSRYIPSCNSGDNENFEVVPPDEPRWEKWLSAAASLYPLYVTFGGAIAFLRPSTFSWFVNMAPTSYSFTLGFIMFTMGITLEFKELINLFSQRPISVSLLGNHLFA